MKSAQNRLKTSRAPCITWTDSLVGSDFQLNAARYTSPPLDDFRRWIALAGTRSGSHLYQPKRILQSFSSGGCGRDRACCAFAATTSAAGHRPSDPRSILAERVGTDFFCGCDFCRPASPNHKEFRKRRPGRGDLFWDQRNCRAARSPETAVLRAGRNPSFSA